MRFERLSTRSAVQDLIKFHNTNSGFITLDVETTSINAREAQLLDIQLSGYDADHAVMFGGEFAEELREIAPGVILVAHNYKYDAHVLFRHGVDLLGRRWRDTMLQAHLLDENRASYSLDTLVKEGWDDPYKEVFWGKYQSYAEAPAEEQLEYACKDIYYTTLIYRAQEGRAPESLVDHVHRLAAELLRTEIKGIAVDMEYLAELGSRLKAQVLELRPLMREMVADYADLVELNMWEIELAKRKTDKGKANVARPEFSFDSAKQLGALLYDSIQLPPQRNEKTRAISVDDASLEKLKEDHPIIPLIQEYRGLTKIIGTYIDGTLDRQRDGRIYPEFRVNGTKTGRISHSNPNLGQLPKTGGVRGIYRPDPTCVLLSADYSQLEVCLEANLTGDPQLARIFREGLSKHDITATELSVDRHTAKTLNFALQYWATHFKVAKLLKVPEKEAARIWANYWKLYAGPKRLKAETDRMVDAGIPIETLFGRKRRFEVRNRNPWDGDYRQAYNFLIQGTGADFTSQAFYLISEWLRGTGRGRGLFTVHDEIVVECQRDCWLEVEARLLTTMVQVGTWIGLQIPLKAESSGPMQRWED